MPTALFLDIDGTLLNIAEQPGLVIIPPGLPALLESLHQRLSGAFAFISGRPLHEIDAFFPGQLPAAAEHGATLRGPNGQLHQIASRPALFEHWLQRLNQATQNMPGIAIETKQVSLVIHYRQAPQFEMQLLNLAEELIVQSAGQAHLLRAHMAFELRPNGYGKDSALTWFMAQPPYAGRAPIFVGDDTTDEPAIALAAKLGGTGLHVARDFGGSPANVRSWLADMALED